MCSWPAKCNIIRLSIQQAPRLQYAGPAYNNAHNSYLSLINRVFGLRNVLQYASRYTRILTGTPRNPQTLTRLSNPRVKIMMKNRKDQREEFMRVNMAEKSVKISREMLSMSEIILGGREHARLKRTLPQRTEVNMSSRLSMKVSL